MLQVCEDDGHALVAGSVQTLEVGVAVSKHSDVPQSPQRRRERTRGVDKNQVHQHLGECRCVMRSRYLIPFGHCCTCNTSSPFGRIPCCFTVVCNMLSEKREYIYQLITLQKPGAWGDRCQVFTNTSETLRRLRREIRPDLHYPHYSVKGISSGKSRNKLWQFSIR